MMADWWTDPRLAYAAGLADGHAAGHLEAYALADVELCDWLHRALAGHEREIRARDLRRAADANRPRPGDWPGLEHMTPIEQRRAYRALVASWEPDRDQVAA